MSAEKRRQQCSRLVYSPLPLSGFGNCCNYKSNYDKRARGWRCRVCGVVYAKLPT